MVYGAYFKDVNESKLNQLGIVSGIEVISIKKGKFEDIGIEKGFIITHINKKAVESKTKFISLLKIKRVGFLLKVNIQMESKDILVWDCYEFSYLLLK